MKNKLVTAALSVLVLSMIAVLATRVARAKPERRARQSWSDVSFTASDWPPRFEMYVNVRSERAATLPAGLILWDGSPEHQKLVVDREVQLGPGDETRVRVFCLDRERMFPNAGTLRVVGRVRGIVARILAASPDTSREIRQRAIWVVRGARYEGLDENGAEHAEIAALIAEARRRRG